MTSNLYGVIPSKELIKSLVDTNDNLSTGLRFPIGKNNILFNKSSKEELIKGQIRQLLFTVPGERVMLPSFGLHIRQYLFSPIDSIIIENIKKEIYKQVRFYVLTAELLQLRVSEIEQTNTSLPGLTINLSLKEKATNEIIPMEINL